MDINDKAVETPDVMLMRDAQYSGFILEDTELAEADDITAEGEFPEFGEFLECSVTEGGRSVFVECPQSLAAGLVELEIAAGDGFRIGEAVKRDGAWDVDVSAGVEKS